jgi:hypothetical protein
LAGGRRLAFWQVRAWFDVGIEESATRRRLMLKKY